MPNISLRSIIFTKMIWDLENNAQNHYTKNQVLKHLIASVQLLWKIYSILENTTLCWWFN
jgi:hypothetical protein